MLDKPAAQDVKFKLEEATIDELHAAIKAGRTTLVDVVTRYLARVRAYNGVASMLVTEDGAPVPPAGSDTGGTLIGLGPPLGSPLPVVNIPTPPMVGPITCVPGTDGCDPIAGGGGGSNDCKWTLPNPANKIIQTPIPCGRVSWRQLR